MIKNAKLIHHPASPENGMPEDLYAFEVTFDDGVVATVPNDPLNRHYQELTVWYKAQTKKPFKYDFGGQVRPASSPTPAIIRPKNARM